MNASNDYAKAKGSGMASNAGEKPETRRPLPPLSEAEHAQVAEYYELVKKHLPELVPTIKELHEAGLIDGLRAIRNVQVFNGKES